MSNLICAKIKIFFKTLWEKTLVFTVIGFILAIFFPDASNDWISAFLGTTPLLLLALLCSLVRLIKIFMPEGKIIVKYDEICHKEIMDAYFIFMTYMTGVWIGLFFHMNREEWWEGGETILLGYCLQVAIIFLYNVGNLLTYNEKKIENKFSIHKFFHIVMNLLFIIYLLGYILERI